MHRITASAIRHAILPFIPPEIDSSPARRQAYVTRLEPALRQPMVIVSAGRPWWGRPDADQAWRQSHADIAAASPRRRLIVAERSQHMVPESEPEVVVTALKMLLDELP